MNLRTFGRPSPPALGHVGAYHLQRFSPEDLGARQESIATGDPRTWGNYNVYADGDRLGRPWSLDLLPLRDFSTGMATHRSGPDATVAFAQFDPCRLLRPQQLPNAALSRLPCCMPIPIFCGPARVCARWGRGFCSCMRSTWPAGRMGPGGCWPTELKRLQGQGILWKIGWCFRGCCRMSSGKAMCKGWLDFFEDRARYLARSGAQRQRYPERGAADARTVQ